MGLGEAMCCARGNAEEKTHERLLMEMQGCVCDRPSAWVHVSLRFSPMEEQNESNSS